MNRLMGSWSLFGTMLTINLLSTAASAVSPSESVILSSTQTPSEIQWHDDLKSGWQESQRTGRPMVIFITSASCRYCDAMKSTTWHDSGIEKRIGKEFIAVRLCPERNATELSRIAIDVFPTTLVALPQGKVIDFRKGFQPPDLLHGLLNQAMH